MAVAHSIGSIGSTSPDGVRARETHDLLEVLLGAAVADAPAIAALARAIDSGALRVAASMPDEPSIEGVAPAGAAVALAAAFELTRRAALPQAPAVIRGPADVAAIAQRDLGGLRREHVVVIACDAANRPLRTIVVAQGAIDGAPIPVREILNAALRCDARAFAIAHNHPGSDREPSDADVAASERIKRAARIVGLRFLGHLVIGGSGWTAVATSERRILD